MHRREFRNLICQRPVLLDAPLPLGCHSSRWSGAEIFHNFDEVIASLTSFKDICCDIVRCPSAGLNRFVMKTALSGEPPMAMNRELMRRCCAALGDTPVFGTVSTTGQRLEPYGTLDFDDAVTCYAEQGRALLEGGAQGFILCGPNDIQEARAALIALRELQDCPCIVELTVNSQGQVIGGTEPLSAMITLQALGADAIGFVSTEASLSLAPLLKGLKPFATVALYGVVPRCTTPVECMLAGESLVAAGANLLGCSHQCSTTDQYALGVRLHNLPAQPVQKSEISALSSLHSSVLLGPQHPFAIVGERINPTGKKKLQANLRQGDLELVHSFALEQEQRGAAVLDVNMGLSGIDEKAMMLKATGMLSHLTPLPLCIDTTRPDVMEAVLRRYPGRALVNSVSGERARIEETLPAAAKYGAMFILLPLTDAGIPETTKERIAVVESVLETATSYGYGVEDCVVDGLVMTISANPEAAQVTLDLIGWCAETLQANTIVGLSNVSFGMPERQWINSAFLGMAMGRGLTMAIANPSANSIMATTQSYNALWGHDLTLLLNGGALTPENV